MPNLTMSLLVGWLPRILGHIKILRQVFHPHGLTSCLQRKHFLVVAETLLLWERRFHSLVLPRVRYQTLRLRPSRTMGNFFTRILRPAGLRFSCFSVHVICFCIGFELGHLDMFTLYPVVVSRSEDEIDSLSLVKLDKRIFTVGSCRSVTEALDVDDVPVLGEIGSDGVFGRVFVDVSNKQDVRLNLLGPSLLVVCPVQAESLAIELVVQC